MVTEIQIISDNHWKWILELNLQTKSNSKTIQIECLFDFGSILAQKIHIS